MCINIFYIKGVLFREFVNVNITVSRDTHFDVRSLRTHAFGFVSMRVYVNADIWLPTIQLHLASNIRRVFAENLSCSKMGFKLDFEIAFRLTVIFYVKSV